VLAVINGTRNGASECELRDLIPELTDTAWSLFCYLLQQYLVLSSVAGLLVFANNQVM